jgi:hypothetical protein
LKKPLDPIGKASAEDIKDHLEWATRKDSPQRHQLFRDWEFNRLYMQNEQWLEEAIGAVTGANGKYQSPFLQPISDGDDYAPRPVHNEILPVVQNEVARSVSAGSQVTVPPNDSGPTIKKAAKLAQDVLRSRNEEIDFKQLKMNFVRNQTIYGLGIFITEQQTDYTKTMRKPKSVMACPDCQWMASVKDHDTSEGGVPVLSGMHAIKAARHGASPVNFRMGNYFGGAAEPILDGLGEDAPKALMDRCPECGASPLVNREAQGNEEFDYAENEVHEEVPVGDIFTGVVTPRDFFPHANGRLDPDGKIRRWATEEIVSLDFVAQFYEDGYKVKKGEDDLVQLQRWHPQGFEDGTYIVDTTERDMEDHTCLRREVRLPYFETDQDGKRKYYDRGRWTVMAGDVILIDDHLMIEDERSGEMIPRCMVHVAPWEPRDKSIWGTALVTFLRSPQDNQNTAFAQAIEARHDFSSPKVWLQPGQNMEYLGQTYGAYTNSVYRWTGGNDKPIIQAGVSLNEQWKYEVQEYREAISRISSSRDVEQGNAPPGVTAASALQLLAEKASVTRGPRIESTTNAIQSVHKHTLQLMGILYHEERDFRAGGRGDRLAMKAFRGTDLLGQCDVVVAIEPFVESPVLKREAANEAFKDGTLQLRTAGDRSRFLAIRGVAPDIAPGEGLQVETATEEWLDFVEHVDEDGQTSLKFGDPPVVKSEYDNHDVHIEQHTIDLMSWEGDEMRANWDPITVKLAGWEDEWQKLEQAKIMLKQAPPGDLPPTPPQGPDGTVNPDMAIVMTKEWKQKKDLEATIAAMPKLTELQIFELWKKKLDEGTTPLTLGEPDLALLRFLAHIEGHRSEQKKKQDEAMAMQMATKGPQQNTSPPPAQAPGMVA